MDAGLVYLDKAKREIKTFTIISTTRKGLLYFPAYHTSLLTRFNLKNKSHVPLKKANFQKQNSLI